MNAEEKNRYFQELTLNLQHEGFAVKPETEEGLLPIELDGQRLCLALDTGSVRYWREDTADDHRSAALDKAISITKTTAEYMRQMETAPQLTASGLTGDYRLLADFNDVVLAGHPTRYGVQFATWERVRERAGLNAGNFYGPPGGVDSYTAANEDLKARRGLPAQEAEEHPQLIAASEVCGRIGVYMEECVIPERVGRELTNALCGYEMNLRRDYPEGAMTCIELASALALYAYGRGLRQLGEPHSSEELLEQLRSCIHPHQNRSSLNSRTAVLAEQAHAVLKLASKPGIRSEAEKRQLTEGWLELALSCAKISVKYEADVLKQQQKQEQAALQQEMG